MARILFHRDFDWHPPERPRALIAFKAGRTYTVRQACAEAALAAGAGVAGTAARRRPRRVRPAETPESGA